MTFLMWWMWIVGMITVYGLIRVHDDSPWTTQDWLLLISWPVSMPLLWFWEIFIGETNL